MPTVPRSPYAVAKLAAEGYTRVFAGLYGMRTVSLRYFNVFGPRQDPTSAYAAAIPRFITAYIERRAPVVALTTPASGLNAPCGPRTISPVLTS